MTILRGSKKSSKPRVKYSKNENSHHVTLDAQKRHKLPTNAVILWISTKFMIF
jgi:hypothetical protein